MHRVVFLCVCASVNVSPIKRARFLRLCLMTISHARTLRKVVLFCVCHESVACVCKLVVRNIINI